MESTSISIKNMVCPRCIDSVKEMFNNMNIEILQVELGRVTTTSPISTEEKQTPKSKLFERGFELLEDQNSKAITQIKAIAIEQIHSGKESFTINFSTFLSDRVIQNYTSLM